MDNASCCNLSMARCKPSVAVLACAWTAGLFSGLLFSSSAGDSLFPAMLAAARSPVSVFGLLASILLPFLFTAFAVYISQPRLLVPIAFFKAFLFSYLGFGILTAFGSAGWLVRLLLTFSDLFTMPLLWWIWLNDTPETFIRRCAAAFLVAAPVGIIDYCIISPFLAMLIS